MVHSKIKMKNISSGIYEQITHILTLNKMSQEEIDSLIKDINKIIVHNRGVNEKILGDELIFHGNEYDKHYEKFKRNGSKNQNKKHLRHMFIAEFIEKLLRGF